MAAAAAAAAAVAAGVGPYFMANGLADATLVRPKTRSVE